MQLGGQDWYIVCYSYHHGALGLISSADAVVIVLSTSLYSWMQTGGYRLPFFVIGGLRIVSTLPTLVLLIKVHP